jgi:hypothetical protein
VFDHYIGLGVDCESVVQLRRLTGTQACVFDWQRLNQEPLIRILRADFHGYFQLDNLVVSPNRHYVIDADLDMDIYHLFTTDFDGTINAQRIPREYPKVRARQEYLLARWRRMVGSAESALYVRRDPYNLFTAENMLEFRDVMRERYPTHRFAVLWVRAPETPAEDAADVGAGPIVDLAEGVYVTEMAVPEPRETYWQGDDAAWDRLIPHLRQLSPVELVSRRGR